MDLTADPDGPTVEPLPPEALRRRCDPDTLAFETTAELEPLGEVVGQERALSALQFGLNMRRKGYNVFALGPTGSGRHTVVQRILAREAEKRPAPPDWCYVYNFAEPRQPRALSLPAGKAVGLRDAMSRLVEELGHAIPAAFESEEYEQQREGLERELKDKHEQELKALREYAAQQSIGVGQAPMGFALAPMKDGKVLEPEEAEKLPEAEQERIKESLERVRKRLKTLMDQVPRWRKEHRDRLLDLDRQTSGRSVEHLIGELRERYRELPDVLHYLDDVQADVVDNVRQFLPQKDSPEALLLSAAAETSPLRRYAVNVMVDNGSLKGAPVVTEDHPAVPSLMGRVEHASRFGTLQTDFTLVKPGALHRANGGFLIVDVRKLLSQTLAWEQLKRALRSEEIRTEALGELMGLVSTQTLEPEPIPLDVKVVLVGERRVYYLLEALDPELGEHFKVPADFDDEMERDGNHVAELAKLCGTIVREKELRALTRSAVARVVEEASRWVEDSRKISTNIRKLADLLVEADQRAHEAGRDAVTAADVQTAVDAAIHRLDRVRDRVTEAITQGRLHVDIDGEVVGQVNALSVRILGDFEFGHPSRVTARARLGRGQVVDIEREVELGGPIHSKGVLILGGFLGGRFGAERPLPVAATLVFEQTYGGVEGDSASLAELCALMSALGRVPVRQAVAITGSVDQLGRVQAVGGVNAKVEGFFDTIRARQEPDGQGVIIPADNVRDLMLREEVVEAARAGRFHVWPVRTVDEALVLLTGISAGARDAEGAYPADSVNGRVDTRIAELVETARKLAARDGEPED